MSALVLLEYGRRLRTDPSPNAPAVTSAPIAILFRIWLAGETSTRKRIVARTSGAGESLSSQMISEARSHQAAIYAGEKEMPCPMTI
jgi:hypothetical protein